MIYEFNNLNGAAAPLVAILGADLDCAHTAGREEIEAVGAVAAHHHAWISAVRAAVHRIAEERLGGELARRRAGLAC